MLKQKRIFLGYISDVDGLIDDSFLSKTELIKLKEEIKNTELIVPVVGGFSSGKSTLINSFLGLDILPTNLTPETALATELRYYEKNYIEAIKDDDSIDRYEIEQFEKIKSKASDYKFLRVYLNNKKLKEIEPLVLVDMPGFDSPLKLHNKAILNYLERGVYFVVLVSIEDGGVSKSILRELENISEFGKDFSFCLSKTNLKPKKDIQDIKTRIKEQLSDELDFEKDIILLDDNGGENLNQILKDIDSENLFYSLFIDELKDSYFSIDSEISTKISTLKNTKEESLETIHALQNSIKKIVFKKEQLILNTKERYSDKSIEKIIEAVALELLKNQDYLIMIALQNTEQFEREINSIIKNKLIYELNKNLDSISSDIVKDFSFELKDLNIDTTLDEKFVETIINTIKKLLQSKKTDKSNSFIEGKDRAIYKTVTTIIGVTTSIVNPILEMIVIFLPDILNFFQKNRQKEILKQKFHSEIIPSLKIRLREVVQNAMQEQINKLIEDISNQFEEKIKQKREEIEQTLKEKEQNIKNSKKEIERLQELKVKLQTITTQLLKED